MVLKGSSAGRASMQTTKDDERVTAVLTFQEKIHTVYRNVIEAFLQRGRGDKIFLMAKLRIRQLKIFWNRETEDQKCSPLFKLVTTGDF